MALNFPNIPAKLRRPSRLPLAQDKSRFFLPFMVALMVFIATLADAGVMSVNTLIDRWNKDLSGSITVKISTVSETDKQEELDTRIKKTLAFLEKYPEVKSVKLIDDEQMKKLLAPWFGDQDFLLNDLPLPKLVDVKLKNLNVNVDEMQQALNMEVKDVEIDKHRMFIEKVEKFANGVKTIAFSTLILVLTATAAIVIYASITSFYVHKNTIEVMHMLGARDIYISWLFTRRTMGLAIFGSLIGFLFAIPPIFSIGTLAVELGGGMVKQIALDTYHIIMLFLVPFTAVVISTMASMITVNKNLKELL